jgi:hypothetical protein
MTKRKRQSVAATSFARSASVGASATLATPLIAPAQADSENNDEKRKARYKETDHVKKYYRVNRYPG